MRFHRDRIQGPLFALAAACLALAAPVSAEPDPAAVAIARDVEADVRWLADDAREGRYPGSDGWLDTQEYLIDELEPIADGLVSGAPGRAAYRQQFLATHPSFGEVVLSNIVAVIPGDDLADEWVVVGGHYDHLSPQRCREVDGDKLCNGANDNAAGTAAVLSIARAIAASPTPPRRSIAIALWDGEEYGLLGSEWFASEPLVPLAQISTYVNLDLLGATLAPSTRNVSFAVGPESGGALLEQMTGDAIAATDLDMRMLSQVFGQGRSDYVAFLAALVPIVFFGDSTNACYHSGKDDLAIVHFDKLADQSEIAFRLVHTLANADERPSSAPLTQIDDYEDLLALSEVLTGSLADIEHVSEAYRDDLIAIEATTRERVALGPEAYQQGWAATAGLAAIDVARFGFPCDATLLPEPGAAGGAAAATALAGLARARRRSGASAR